MSHANPTPESPFRIAQSQLRSVADRFGIVFDNLYTITNLPISRFLEFLEERGTTEEYLARLVNAYNPAAASGVMCRITLSVGWDGATSRAACDLNPSTPNHV